MILLHFKTLKHLVLEGFMAFSRELLRGLAAELVRLGISLFGEKPPTCPEGPDPFQLADKSTYWEAEARSCREDLRGFVRCEVLLETCQDQLRFVTALVFLGVALGLLAGVIVSSWVRAVIETRGEAATQIAFHKSPSESQPRRIEEAIETGKDELASARARARMLRG